MDAKNILSFLHIRLLRVHMKVSGTDLPILHNPGDKMHACKEASMHACMNSCMHASMQYFRGILGEHTRYALKLRSALRVEEFWV